MKRTTMGLASAAGWLLFLLMGWMHSSPWLLRLPHASPPLFRTAEAVTVLGNPGFLVAASVLVVLYLALYKRSWLLALTMAINMLAGWGLMEALKTMWAIPRPPGPYIVAVSGYTFPSGHAMMSIIFYGFITWYLLRACRFRGWPWLLMVLPLLVGISRPLLMVHYPADVLGGWGAGLGWLCLVLIGYNWGEEKLKMRFKDDY